MCANCRPQRCGLINSWAAATSIWTTSEVVRGENIVQTYAIEDLGEISPGVGCQGSGINGHGDVVGLGSVPGFRFHAILRRSNGQITDLGTLHGPTVNSSARAINSRRTIVGTSAIDDDFNPHAFLI